MVTGDGRQAPTGPTLSEDDDLAGRLALAVGRFNRRLRSSTGDLSHGQLSALSTIVRRGPLRPSEISAIEVVAAPTTTRVVSDLEARGLVKREQDPDDGRSFFVSGTEAGIELLLRARSDRARAVHAILDELTPEQAELLRQALPALEAAALLNADA
ncbi:MarR family winged helix-turn-helix transcriptional regulator [Leifsonia poae]|uniref:MarR family transcriptional regulator n=1 Tax=Leifsonia poae TaxID=110933 RepID=A0A9W6LZ30_9MICO|nr:MarR family transcriptional regulator [Leifsonia poae]GLJ75436.1 MarR family transcriptional regulator [Leifsonia poae]